MVIVGYNSSSSEVISDNSGGYNAITNFASYERWRTVGAILCDFHTWFNNADGFIPDKNMIIVGWLNGNKNTDLIALESGKSVIMNYAWYGSWRGVGAYCV